jgi:hypothetical protein
MTADVNLSPDEVKNVLERLKKVLAPTMADRQKVMDKVFGFAKGRNREHELEAAWVDAFILKAVHEFLLNEEKLRLNGKQPKDFILAESKSARLNGWTVGSPARTPGHPFNKIISKNPEEIYARWRGGELNQPKSALAWVCPDFALLQPYRIVFECKYFRSDGVEPAEAALVEGLYETFFYRSMPQLSKSKKHGAAWDYEFACFIAFDGTQHNRLAKAWVAIEERVGNSFWDEANIFVMIFPG